MTRSSRRPRSPGTRRDHGQRADRVGAQRHAAAVRRRGAPGGAEHRRENPENQPGGAGDEEGVRSPAMFTGRNGRITPKVVRVPPFLAIRAELRSADGRDYTIRFGKQVLRNGRSLELDGLRPQRA